MYKYKQISGNKKIFLNTPLMFEKPNIAKVLNWYVYFEGKINTIFPSIYM